MHTYAKLEWLKEKCLFFPFRVDLPLPTMHRYAYSEGVGEESADEEGQSLTKGRPESELVKQEKNTGDEDDSEEDKKE